MCVSCCGPHSVLKSPQEAYHSPSSTLGRKKKPRRIEEGQHNAHREEEKEKIKPPRRETSKSRPKARHPPGVLLHHRAIRRNRQKKVTHTLSVAHASQGASSANIQRREIDVRRPRAIEGKISICEEGEVRELDRRRINLYTYTPGTRKGTQTHTHTHTHRSEVPSATF